MVLAIIEVLFVFIVSYLILKFCKVKIVSTLGTVGTAYIIGICFSIIVTLLRKFGVVKSNDTTALELLGYLGIAVGIPLLLFSSNVKYVLKLSGKVFLSYMLLIVSVVLVCMGGFLLFTRKIPDGDILTGMAAGLYSGGTTNLNAIAGFFRLNQQTIFMANLSDMIFGGLFYVFLVFLAKPLTGKFLGKGLNGKNLGKVKNGSFSGDEQTGKISEEKKSKDDLDLELSSEDESKGFSLKSRGVIRNFFLSFLMVIVSAGVGYLIFVLKGSVDGTLIDCLLPAILIGTAILGLAASFSKKISSVKENSTMGQYFVTVFSLAIASMFDFSNFEIVTLKIFAAYSGITIGVFVIHMLLCRVFRVDANTMIITSTAGIYGPAFIPGVSKAIGAEYLLAGGLITGSLGYSIGTFLGIGITWLCRVF